MTEQELIVELENIRRMIGEIAGGVQNTSSYGAKFRTMKRTEMMSEARVALGRIENVLKKVRLTRA